MNKIILCDNDNVLREEQNMSRQNIAVVKKQDIVCIKSQHVYSEVVVATGVDQDGVVCTKKLNFRCSLSEWMNILGNDEFYRIHRSCIVHFSYISQIAPVVQTKDLMEYPLSRRKAKGFRESYISYCRESLQDQIKT